MKEKKTNCGIYKITNLVPNEITGVCKVYIGSSSNLKSRKYKHFRALISNMHENSYFQKAYNKIIKKYVENGSENFKFEVIKYIEKIEDKIKLKEDLLRHEQEYLNEYIIDDNVDHSRCYNLSPTAGSPLGRKLSEKTKEKISKSNKGKLKSEEFKQKCRENNLGKKLSEETKEKMSSIRRGNLKSEEHKEKIGKGNKGKKHSEEQNKNKSNRLKGTDPLGHLPEDEKNKVREKIVNSIKEKCSKKVKNLTTEEIFNSIKEAAEKYDIKSPYNITEVCKGNRKTAGKCKWKYFKGEE
jgi:group I intron endonuclease